MCSRRFGADSWAPAAQRRGLPSAGVGVGQLGRLWPQAGRRRPIRLVRQVHHPVRRYVVFWWESGSSAQTAAEPSAGGGGKKPFPVTRGGGGMETGGGGGSESDGRGLDTAVEKQLPTGKIINHTTYNVLLFDTKNR